MGWATLIVLIYWYYLIWGWVDGLALFGVGGCVVGGGIVSVVVWWVWEWVWQW